MFCLGWLSSAPFCISRPWQAKGSSEDHTDTHTTEKRGNKPAISPPFIKLFTVGHPLTGYHLRGWNAEKSKLPFLKSVINGGLLF